MTDKIPKGWKRVKLGEVVDIGSSKRIFYKEYTNTGVPFYRSKEIIEKHHRKEISTDLYITEKKYNEIKNKFGVPHDKDILLTSVGTLGIPYIVRNNEKFYFKDGNLTWFRNYDKNNLFYKFLYYWLLSPIGHNQLLNSVIGSTQPALTIRGLKQIEILLPPIPIQKAIAEVLGSLDDKIDLLVRENKTLEQMAGTLFRQWFIEEAKDDWEEKPLKSIYRFEKGFEPGSKSYSEEKTGNAIRFIRVGDMPNSNANIYINRNLAVKTCKESDLLVSFDGTVGRVIFGIQGAYSSGIRKIYSDNPIYDNLGLKYLIFTSKDIQDLMKSHATGTVILHASSSIEYLTFNFPTDDKIEEFDKVVSPIFDKILENKRQIRTLENLRDTLLPKLMSGEVRVKA